MPLWVSLINHRAVHSTSPRGEYMNLRFHSGGWASLGTVHAQEDDVAHLAKFWKCVLRHADNETSTTQQLELILRVEVPHRCLIDEEPYSTIIGLPAPYSTNARWDRRRFRNKREFSPKFVRECAVPMQVQVDVHSTCLFLGKPPAVYFGWVLPHLVVLRTGLPEPAPKSKHLQ